MAKVSESLSILTRKQIETALEVAEQFENIDTAKVLRMLAVTCRDTSRPFNAYFAACHICASLTYTQKDN